MGDVDIALRNLATLHLRRLVPGLLPGRKATRVRVERTTLPTLVDRSADDVVIARVDGVETIVHTEFQTRHTPELPQRVLVYHALLARLHFPRPVLSVVVYLMPRPPRRPIPRGIVASASSPQLSFAYEVVCPWERPIDLEAIRRCPALAPIASLTPGIGERDLPALCETVAGSGLGREEASDLLAITYVVAGCRFGSDVLQYLVRSGVMESSVTYQEILKQGEARGRAEGEARGRAEGEAQGRASGLRAAVLALVRTRLGALPPRLEKRLASWDAERLDGLFARLLAAESPVALRKLLPR